MAGRTIIMILLWWTLAQTLLYYSFTMPELVVPALAGTLFAAISFARGDVSWTSVLFAVICVGAIGRFVVYADNHWLLGMLIASSVAWTLRRIDLRSSCYTGKTWPVVAYFLALTTELIFVPVVGTPSSSPTNYFPFRETARSLFVLSAAGLTYELWPRRRPGTSNAPEAVHNSALKTDPPPEKGPQR